MAYLLATTDTVEAVSYAEKLMATDPTDAWFSAKITVPAAALATFWTQGTTNLVVVVRTPGGLLKQAAQITPTSATDFQFTFRAGTGSSPTGSFVADTEYLVEMHLDRSTSPSPCELFVDGVSVQTVTRLSFTSMQLLDVGLDLNGDLFDAQMFVRDVIVGTTQGASDVFNGAVTATIVPPFDSIIGDVVLSDGPEAPPEEEPSPLDPFGLGRFYEAPPWRLVVTNLDSEIQTWLDKLAFQRTVTYTRGQPTVIDTGVPSDNPEVNIDALDGDPFVAEGNRLVFAFRRDGGTPPWRIWAAGIALGVRDSATSDSANTTLTAYDPRQLLRRRPVLKDATGVLPDEDFGLRLTSGTAAEILIEQLDLMEFWETGPLPTAALDWGQTYFYEGTIETTPVIDEITFARGVSIGEMMDKLEETGTCEFVIRAIWDPVNRPGIVGELSIYERAGTARNGAVFGYDTFPKNLVGIDHLVDGRERANEVQFYAGQGGPPVPRYDDATSLAKYGHYFAQQFFPGQVSEAAVEAMAQRVLTLQKNGQATWALSPAAERAPIPLTEYGVFDSVPVYASRRFRQPVAESLRVESIPIVIGDDQLERVSGLLVAVDPVIEAGT